MLDQVSFTARAGTSVALVGGSGVGKSTIAYLATRMLDPDSGVIRLDGHDLRELTLESVRRHVVLVEQEPTLLHATIEENIRYVRPDATADQVRHAAEAAGIARSSSGCRRPTAPSSASAAWRCRLVSASAWRWRARFLPIPRCSCSTNRPRRWIPSRSAR